MDTPGVWDRKTGCAAQTSHAVSAWKRAIAYNYIRKSESSSSASFILTEGPGYFSLRCNICDSTTSTTDKISISVEIALISGVTPRRICPAM
jgi:hypothetical protein